LKENENQITVLSQRQLSDDDVGKLESLQATLLQLQTSQTETTELRSKVEITERMWSQALGNEKAAVTALSELINKFNKRWSELSTANSIAISTPPVQHRHHLPVDASNQATDGEKSATTSSSNNDVSTTEVASITDSLTLDSDVAVDHHLRQDHPHLILSRQITELQHKLQQAMEHVRLAELSRENLKIALSMNTSLQTKLDETKAKYTALQASRGSNSSSNINSAHVTATEAIAGSTSNSIPPTASTSNNHHIDAAVTTMTLSDSNKTASTTALNDVLATTTTSTKATSSKEKNRPVNTPREKDSTMESKSSSSSTRATTSSGGNNNSSNNTNATSRSSSSSSSEKLHREYRRVRKELAALSASHATLMSNNVRLLKQITEKDEMNAKSLSTILHLKSMSATLKEERDTLELQMKSASQLALAARLATNAKDRVSEELIKEKNEVEARCAELEQQLHTTKLELQRTLAEWSNSSSRIARKETELSNVVQRSNVLVEENEQKREEIRKLVDIVGKAEREAREAQEKLSNFITKSSSDTTHHDTVGGSSGVLSSSSSSNFTMDQLKTQVSVLKNRLACPVCHYRDKECIILRCRHMHCKQCVDERVSNRSRKCPTCNVKFAENDVETIFLS
jgi:Zinc finger, C3HC4 type (RING finger)